MSDVITRAGSVTRVANVKTPHANLFTGLSAADVAAILGAGPLAMRAMITAEACGRARFGNVATVYCEGYQRNAAHCDAGSAVYRVALS
ncbi:MAG TPA: hypothetical protein VHE33_10065 [Acidobacteriaceae bacterium]|nr:hypothetical protein [Acidobacteriaceae bacterium]